MEVIVENRAYLAENHVHSCSGDGVEAISIPLENNLRVNGTTFFLYAVNGTGQGPKTELTLDLDTAAPTLVAGQILHPSINDLNRSPFTFSFNCEGDGEILILSSARLDPAVQEFTCSRRGKEDFLVAIAADVFETNETISVQVADEARNLSSQISFVTGLDSLTHS